MKVREVHSTSLRIAPIVSSLITVPSPRRTWSFRTMAMWVSVRLRPIPNSPLSARSPPHTSRAPRPQPVPSEEEYRQPHSTSPHQPHPPHSAMVSTLRMGVSLSVVPVSPQGAGEAQLPGEPEPYSSRTPLHLPEMRRTSSGIPPHDDWVLAPMHRRQYSP